jgi:Lrp/AsnC family transcriptional regulator, leucine-responsive regulatory protein
MTREPHRPPLEPRPHHEPRPHAADPQGVDATDRAIVIALSKDGRLSFTELAHRIGLSVSAVHQRVRRLEQRGIIQGYSARVDLTAVGLPLTAFVSIKPLDPAAPDDAPERLAALPEIEACYSVAGEEFYLLKVRVESPGELERLLQEIRSGAGVSTKTTVVLSTPYEGRVTALSVTTERSTAG